MIRSRPEDAAMPSAAQGGPAAAPLPWPVKPMLAKQGPLPRDAARWAYEFKWDGFRTLLFVEGGKARVQSRNLRDVTGDYPELQAIAEALGPGRTAILDGEVLAFGPDGKPSFEALLRRAGLAPGPRERAPVVFVAYDLLHLDGRDLTPLPYTARRAALEGLGLAVDGWWVPAWHRDGQEVLEASEAMGLEGVVAKRLDSPYEPGLRTGAWVKHKLLRRQEFVVGGWTLGEGGRAGKLGALLVGYHEGGALRYAGRVGTGFTERMLDRLGEALAPLRAGASPFAPDPTIPRGAVFVEPLLVAEVQFTTWTPDGHLRLPSFKGLRADKDPAEVVREDRRGAGDAADPQGGAAGGEDDEEDP